VSNNETAICHNDAMPQSFGRLQDFPIEPAHDDSRRDWENEIGVGACETAKPT
jgi:hypothetical protein